MQFSLDVISITPIWGPLYSKRNLIHPPFMPSYDACIWLGWDGFYKHSFFDYITTSPTSLESLDLYSDVHYTFHSWTIWAGLVEKKLCQEVIIHKHLFSYFFYKHWTVVWLVVEFHSKVGTIQLIFTSKWISWKVFFENCWIESCKKLGTFNWISHV